MFEADRVIVTLPPTLAGRLEYAPALPSWRDQLTQRLPAGSVIKLYAVYDEPFWRADGLTGQAASDRGPVKVTFDNSPPDGSPGVLMGFMEANDGRAAARLSARGAPRRRASLLRPLLRAEGGAPHRVHRAGLDGRGVQPGLLRRPLHARGVGRLRGGPDRAGRPDPLGGSRVLVGVERVHGGCCPIRRGDRPHRARHTVAEPLPAPLPAAGPEVSGPDELSRRHDVHQPIELRLGVVVVGRGPHHRGRVGADMSSRAHGASLTETLMPAAVAAAATVGRCGTGPR